MVCTDCVSNFLNTPWKVSIVILSLAIAVTSLVILLKKSSLNNNQKLLLIYSHIFFLVFPFIFYIFYRGCKVLYATCTQVKPVMIMIVLTSIIAIILGTIVGQALFIFRMKKRSLKMDNNYIIDFVRKYSSKLLIKMPKIHFVNSAKPFAFTYLKSRIFISIGLIDLLDKKEVEAVLLHELSHLKSKSSLLKFWTSLMKIISPIAAFSGFNHHTVHEEQKADEFAVKEQKTSEYLNSAKIKIEQFNSRL